MKNYVEPFNFWKRLWLLLVVYKTRDAKSGDSFSHEKKTILLGYSVKQAGHFRHLTSVLPMKYRLVNFFFKGSQDKLFRVSKEKFTSQQHPLIAWNWTFLRARWYVCSLQIALVLASLVSYISYCLVVDLWMKVYFLIRSNLKCRTMYVV